MTRSSPLATVRKSHFTLEALPDTIVIPVLGTKQPEQRVTPIAEASLDDVAFAIRGLDAEFSAVSDRLYAMKRLYQLARDQGAVGADRALDVLASANGNG